MEDPGITPPDLEILARELREALIGGTVSRAHQYGKASSRQLLLEITTKKGPRLLYWDPGKAFLTERKRPMPLEPPDFCLFLRKHLMGKGIQDISQRGLTLEISTRDNILVLEFRTMLSPGNAILCNPSYKIVMPLEIQKWKNRIVKPGEIYRHPRISIQDSGGLHKLLKPGETLSSMLDEMFADQPLQAERPPAPGPAPEENPAQQPPRPEPVKREPSPPQPEPKQESMEEIPWPSSAPAAREERPVPSPEERPQETPKPEPAEKWEPAHKEEVVSRPMQSGTRDRASLARDVSANDASRNADISASSAKGEMQIPQGGEALDKWARISRESGEKARLIQKNRSLLEQILGAINRVKDSGLSWGEIKSRVMGEQTPEADAIKEIREGDAQVVVELDGKPVELDFRIGVEGNASRYLEDQEWADKKAGRPAPPNAAPASPDPRKPKRRRRKWFEKFHWFLSSDGFLVIGGRDAKQNEMIISKYMNPGDLVFHSESPGASLVVVQSKGNPISLGAKKEAAELAAAASRAWSQGLGSLDVFCARPEQVSREAPGGYLSRGGFMISGEREWFRELEPKLSIGMSIDREKGEARALAGPVMPVRTHSSYFVTIKPGFRRSLELAREIKNKILIKASPEDKFLMDQVPLEDIQRLLPQGSGDIVEYGV